MLLHNAASLMLECKAVEEVDGQEKHHSAVDFPVQQLELPGHVDVKQHMNV